MHTYMHTYAHTHTNTPANAHVQEQDYAKPYTHA